jgi:hypothetical protein
MMKRIIAAALLLLLVGPANSWTIQAPTTGGYVGPGDLVSFTAWYGVRAYTAAKAAAGTTLAINIQRASDSSTCDVLIATTGGLGLTTNCSGAGTGLTVTSFCIATSCTLNTIYDQTGGNHCGGSSCDLIHVNAGASRPTLSTNAAGSCLTPNVTTCFTFSSSQQSIRSVNNFTPAAAKVSISVVGTRKSASGAAMAFGSNIGSGNTLKTNTTTGTWILAGGSSGTISATATENTQHAGNAVINGASSVIMIDGVDTTGTATASTSAGLPGIIPGATLTEVQSEMGFIDNVALTTGERTSLDSNQRSYYGF